MLWFICFFNYADRQAIASVMPKLAEHFKFDEFQQGLILSAFAWVYAAGAPIAGYIADRTKRKHLILGGCLFWSFVTITTGWCQKLWHFVTVRALEGFGETFYFPASMSLVSDYHSKRTRSRAMSIHQSSVYAGTVAGSWFAAWVAQHYGWEYGFYFFGGAGMVLALVLYMFLREPPRGMADGQLAETPLPMGETLAQILKKPTVILLILAFLGANLVATIFLMWTPTFLVKKFGFQLAAAGLSGSVFIHVASALSVPLGGLAADFLARKLAGGRILVQAAGLLVGSVFAFYVGTTTNQTTLIVAMTLFGLCKGLYDSNIFAAMYDAVEPRARASAAGIMNTVGWGGGALGPMIFGYFAEHGSHRMPSTAPEAVNGMTVDKVANMSEAIAWTGAIYIVCTVLLLLAALIFAKRDVIKTADPQTET
jgi:MFS family permease